MLSGFVELKTILNIWINRRMVIFNLAFLEKES